MEWYELTALQLGEKIRAGEVSAVEAAQAALDRMAALQPDNNAFITTLADHALAEAEAVQKKLAAGPAGRCAHGPQGQHLHPRGQDLLCL